MAIVVHGGSAAVASRLATALSWPRVQAETKTFPDGELYVRIPRAVRGEDVVVVEAGYPASRVWDLLLLLNAARENGAKSVRAVVPYFPYARQDRVFLEGEALSAKLAMEALRAHASQLITVELHKGSVASFFGPGCVNLSAVEPFSEDFRRRKIDVVLAPDAGARDRAEAVARRIGAKADHLEKKRLSSEVVEIKPKSLDVKGQSVAILDDIISTGGTMAKATEQLVKSGASRVLCAGVHGLFIGDAVDRLKRAGAREVVCTDSVETPFSNVSVAGLIAETLSKKPVAPARLK